MGIIAIDGAFRNLERKMKELDNSLKEFVGVMEDFEESFERLRDKVDEKAILNPEEK